MHPGPALDLSAFDRAWTSRWPATRPVGRDLKRQNRSLWTRFHTLPEAKRYPTEPGEEEEILHRHHTLLRALLDATSQPGGDPGSLASRPVCRQGDAGRGVLAQ